MRPLPDFVLIGAMRCGTSSLYNYLTQHPSIVPSFHREVHFFDFGFARGLSWYRGEFPALPLRAWRHMRHGRPPITGEKSPYYLFHPHAPRRLAATLPKAKLIILLRNPVDRAYSHHDHEVRKGREPLPFAEAIESEEDRLAGEREKLERDEKYYSFRHQHYSYLSRGLYLDQLKAWREKLPAEQFLILRSEDLFTDPAAVLRRVHAFLDLPSVLPERFEKHNPGSHAPWTPRSGAGCWPISNRTTAG